MCHKTFLYCKFLYAIGPVLSPEDPINIELLSSPNHYPPTLTFHCPSTGFPATLVTWLLNGNDPEALSPSYSQVITDTQKSNYNNSLTIENFNMSGSINVSCNVTNSRGSAIASKTLIGEILYV